MGENGAGLLAVGGGEVSVRGLMRVLDRFKLFGDLDLFSGGYRLSGGLLKGDVIGQRDSGEKRCSSVLPLDRTAHAGHLIVRTGAGGGHLQQGFEQVAARAFGSRLFA